MVSVKKSSSSIPVKKRFNHTGDHDDAPGPYYYDGPMNIGYEMKGGSDFGKSGSV